MYIKERGMWAKKNRQNLQLVAEKTWTLAKDRGKNPSKGKVLASILVEAELKEKYVVEQQQKDLIELQILLGSETIAHLRANWEWDAQKKLAQNLENQLNKLVQSQSFGVAN